MRALVIWSGAGQAPTQIEVEIPSGATAGDAIAASGVLAATGAASIDALDIGIFNRPCALNTALREADRVEIYRPLAVDPKEARRVRAELRKKKKAAHARP